MTLALVALASAITTSADGGLVLERAGFTWRLPAGAVVEHVADAGAGEGHWGRAAAGVHWTVKLVDQTRWHLTQWSVPSFPARATPKDLLRRWQAQRGCVTEFVDGGVPFAHATLQFAHQGGCKGGDQFVRRVAVFAQDGGAVVVEVNAVRFISPDPPTRVPLHTSLDELVGSLELAR
jgi:hypothetical protein